MRLSQEQYDTMIARGLTPERIQVLAEQKGYELPDARSGMQKASDRLDTVFGGQKVGEAIGTGIAKLMASPEERKFIEPAPTGRQVAGSALQSAALFTPVGKAAQGLSAGARALGISKGASAIGKIGAGAATGGAFDVAQTLQTGESGFGGAAIGAAIPGAGVAMNVVGRGAQKVLPKLLSYTSDVPEAAFRTLLDRRGAVTNAIKAGTTPQKALTDTQGAVRQLRTSLTKEWQEATNDIFDEFQGVRMGLPTNDKKLLFKVADDFPIDIPDNLENMSVKESMELLKSINELYSKRAVKEAAQGIGVRKLKEQLESRVLNTFGGKQGSVGLLYKNYSAKKQVLDAADSIVKAYSTGKPIQQSTALGRLQALFNENKTAYLDAILDLEKATGRDLLSGITATKFASKMPSRLSSVSASGGLQAPKGVIDKLIDMMILPLSSPRSAGFITRILSNAKAPTVDKSVSSLINKGAMVGTSQQE